MKKRQAQNQSLPVINPDAAGIDIGSTFHVVAVSPGRSEEPVQTFQSFTTDIHRMADWLVRLGITTVAMESTGVYWVPVYEELESRGLRVILANARETRSVPGRKTDVNDAQWIQQLHACGLLKASFRPGQSIAALRCYLRTRERMLDYAAAHIQHMQKALTHMNIQLHHVIADMTGVTGMKIIRAIVDGERNPAVLAAMRDVRCKSDEATISKALTGNYQAEHLFALKQALHLYDAYQVQIHECDTEIEKTLALLSLDSPTPDKPLPKAGHRTKQPNALNFDVRQSLYHLTGVDLTQIHGIGPYLALRLISECGTDMSKWPTAKHFTSWLTLSPGSKITGGKVLSAHTRKSNNRIVAHLRLAATTLGRTNTALGAFYRRLSARIGKAKAVTATARKIAVLFYNAMRYGMDYQDPGADQYEQQYRERAIKNLRRKAADFGFTLECVS
ncbi:MAG: IS110 family transposase [Candidatus Thiodiazotropha sp.]